METDKKTENTKKTSVKETKTFEASYTIPELVEAAKSEFNASSVLVRAALTKEGKKSYTLKEAKEVIERMKKKEVKA